MNPYRFDITEHFILSIENKDICVRFYQSYLKPMIKVNLRSKILHKYDRVIVDILGSLSRGQDRQLGSIVKSNKYSKRFSKDIPVYDLSKFTKLRIIINAYNDKYLLRDNYNYEDKFKRVLEFKCK